MKRVILPQIPSPPNPANQSSQIAYNQSVYQWLQQTKGILEQCSGANDTPMDQPFVVTTGFTMTSTISGTSTGTQVSNFICTLVNAMIKKGFISQTQTSGGHP